MISGFFLCLDQAFKIIARVYTLHPVYLFKPWIGWEYFENSGIAFSIPLPQSLVIIVTPIIIVGLLFWLVRKKERSLFFLLGNTLIIAGALSNLMDRILYSITIDYFRILTSIFNIADVMIIVGAGLLLLNEIKTKPRVAE